MSGPVVLVGAGAFLTSMADFDLGLLAATGRRRPRVAILATAAFPAGEEAFGHLSAMGQDHFRALGAEVETVDVRDRPGADDAANAQAIGEADLVYLSGGDSSYLRSTLWGSAVWAAAMEANERGAVLVGCSAGAMALGERQLDMGIVRVGWPIRWLTGLAALGGIGVLTDYDARPEAVMALLAMSAPHGMAVLGIGRESAVIGRAGSWEVHGRGRVTVWRGRHRGRHRPGDVFRLSGPAGGRPDDRDSAEE